jgi:hypothetical protein
LPSVVQQSTAISRFENFVSASGINFGVKHRDMLKCAVGVSQAILNFLASSFDWRVVYDKYVRHLYSLDEDAEDFSLLFRRKSPLGVLQIQTLFTRLVSREPSRRGVAIRDGKTFYHSFVAAKF